MLDLIQTGKVDLDQNDLRLFVELKSLLFSLGIDIPFPEFVIESAPIPPTSTSLFDHVTLWYKNQWTDRTSVHCSEGSRSVP